MIESFLPFALPDMGGSEFSEVFKTLESCWITTGPKAKQFEEEFAVYIGSKYAVAVNSCTAALHLALEAIGIQEGDEVITTPMTFAATAEVIRYFKAKPVFMDIDPLTMNLNPEMIEIEKEKSWHAGKAKAIIPVHYAGLPCDMDGIVSSAKSNNLHVIEDAAHAFPAKYKQRLIGTIGDITCFSFYATKNITTGEGGMAITDNPEWAERMRIMSLHGISKDAWKRYTAEGNWYYEIIAPGYKYNLTDIAAALGVAQLRRVDELWNRRRQIAAMYNAAFSEFPEIDIPFSGEFQGEKNGVISDYEGMEHSWHLYVIKLNRDLLKIDRNQFIEELKKRGIGTSVHFIPLHIHPYYRETYGYRPEDFPVAWGMFKRIISLPIYAKMSDGDVHKVIEAVMDVVKKNRR